jgi:hypothetical protein
MFRIVKTLRRRVTRPDYWLAGQFTRTPHSERDRAMATWSEQLGHASAELWIAACKSEGRCR